ncbi:hypothetical protein [Stutzerimonas stutzeri]|uniref:hypothetical protein n=1 Tax=Stutzerimonas stutzeri TaxID=316 RepID=UPI00210D5CA4|nr:hypothetical protein [Stutzerimonas stutzeri]MCQ4320078.1 hypothetical protein [Stutzerimonas stutzeri]
MHGLMQDQPLLIPSQLEHAATFHLDSEIVSKTVEGHIHRTNYGGSFHPVKKVANAIRTMGVEFQDRVGTLAWKTHSGAGTRSRLCGGGYIRWRGGLCAMPAN